MKYKKIKPNQELGGNIYKKALFSTSNPLPEAWLIKDMRKDMVRQ